MKRLILLAALASIFPFATSARAGDLSAQGQLTCTVHYEGTSGSGKCDSLGDFSLQSANGTIMVLSANGKTLATLRTAGNERTVDVQSPAAAYVVRSEGAEYRVFTAEPRSLTVRVKIKDDKFNVYDPNDKRFLHGKQKEGGFVVEDERSSKVLTIKGALTLRETSYLTLPLAIEADLALWFAEVTAK